MMRLITLEVRLTLDPQLLVKRRKTLPLPRFQGVTYGRNPTCLPEKPHGRLILGSHSVPQQYRERVRDCCFSAEGV